MRKVDDYIKEKLKKDPDFKARCDLIKEKAAVVKKIIEYRIRHKLSQEQLAKEIGVTLDLNVTFTHKFLKRHNAEAFIRLEKLLGKGARAELGVRVPF